MPSQAPSPALVYETLNAFQRTEALRAGIELDLFTHIASGKHTADELAAACNASPRGIRILADFLTILGFLTKSGERYGLTLDSGTFLARNSPAYLGGVTQFLLTPDLKDCFAHLTEAVRHGGTTSQGTVSHDNPIWVAFARAMGAMMQMPAKMLAGLIGGARQQPLRVLDVAAGHGLFGITVAQEYPQSHITALDWPNVLAVASENAHRMGVGDRHCLKPGSAFDTDWGGPYDIVLLTNFLHHFDTPTCERLVTKAYSALASGGRVLTLEFVPEPDRLSPPATAMFSLTMLATTPNGDAYTFAEYEKMFASAGFARSEFHTLPPTPQQAIVSFKS